MNDITDSERRSRSADKNGVIPRHPFGSPYLKRQPLADDIKAKLSSEAERTGVGAMRLLRGAKDKPVGLNAYIVQSWLYGSAQSAVPAHVEYALARWAALPSVTRIRLTPEMQATLRAELRRAGVDVSGLCRRRNVPDALTAPMIRSWLKPERPSHPVDKAHWDFVIGVLSAMPETSSSNQTSYSRAASRRDINAEELAELRHHRDRTGIGGAVLLRNATNKPIGLTPTMISSWISGATRTASAEHVAFVLARYRAWP